MTVTIDTREVDALARDLGVAPKQAADAAHQAAKLVGRRVKQAAQRDAPKDRPWLSASGIRLKTWRDRNGTHADIFTVPDDHGRPVGFFVEYGTSDTPPQPFLEPQMTWAAPDFEAAFLDQVDPFK